jgi:hypothetical protein
MTDTHHATPAHPQAPTADDQHPIDDPRDGLSIEGSDEPDEDSALPNGGGASGTHGNGSAG